MPLPPGRRARRSWPPSSSGTTDGQPHVGSTALSEALERIQPRLMVCGHIHSGYGRYRLGSTDVVNAALVDNSYRPVNAPVTVAL